MILNILLLIIFFQLFFDKLREGMMSEINEIDITPPFLGVECELNPNEKFPSYDKMKKTYTNKNKSVYNQKENILKYATSSC